VLPGLADPAALAVGWIRRPILADRVRAGLHRSRGAGVVGTCVSAWA
jgi:hypothetical protein